MTALEIACNHTSKWPGREDTIWKCMAPAGETCRPFPWWTHGITVKGFHPERIEDAAALTRVSDPVSERELEKVVSETGIL